MSILTAIIHFTCIFYVALMLKIHFVIHNNIPIGGLTSLTLFCKWKLNTC